MTPAPGEHKSGPENNPESNRETATAPKCFAICVNRRFGTDRPACGSRGSESLAAAIENGVKSRGIHVVVERIVCFGMCHTGPNMRLIPGGDFYKNVEAGQIGEILDMLEESCGLRDFSADLPVMPGT